MTSSTFTDPVLSQSIVLTSHNYDAVPYISLPFSRLQPSRLAANACLLGLTPATVSRARTLEIGCASGGHIIPLAAMFPEGDFVGIDVSPKQIAQGKERVERLGLKNAVLRTCSVTEVDKDFGSFDYIICHGVYSWVPEVVREAIMRVCGELLSENGIAAVSFNVLPGWRLFQIVRDVMMLHTSGVQHHARRSDTMRQMFELMAKHTPDMTYGAVWRSEASRMAELPDAYLAHELLEAENSPCTFRSVAQRAARHGLAYLCETRLRENVPETGNVERAAVIRQLSGNELLAGEDYIDILTGRTFRESLFIRSEHNGKVDRSLVACTVAHLHLVAPLSLRITSCSTAKFLALDDGSGNVIETKDPLAIAALRYILGRQPASTSIFEFFQGEHSITRDKIRLTNVLLHLILQGFLDITSEPVEAACLAGQAPVAWSLVISDVISGADRTATLRHASLTITPSLRFLLPMLDGKNNRVEITQMLVDLAINGSVEVSDANGRVKDPERVQAICRANIDREIDHLMSVGVLVEA